MNIFWPVVSRSFVMSARAISEKRVRGTIVQGISDKPEVPTRPRKRVRADKTDIVAEVVAAGESAPLPKKRRAKKAKDVSPQPEDYRVRVSSPWKVGAHVSAAGGVENAIQNAASIG